MRWPPTMMFVTVVQDSLSLPFLPFSTHFLSLFPSLLQLSINTISLLFFRTISLSRWVHYLWKLTNGKSSFCYFSSEHWWQWIDVLYLCWCLFRSFCWGLCYCFFLSCEDGTGVWMRPSGAVKCGHQRSFRQVRWCSWAWLPLCAMVSWQSCCWCPFFACQTAWCSVWNQDKGSFFHLTSFDVILLSQLK